MEKIFEKAVREKYRFNFNGKISVEDLWDLSNEALDGIYKGLNNDLKDAETGSLLDKVNPLVPELTNKIAIIKHIVETKINEANRNVDAAKLKAKRQEILDIKQKKQNAELENMSVEELDALLDSME